MSNVIKLRNGTTKAVALATGRGPLWGAPAQDSHDELAARRLANMDKHRKTWDEGVASEGEVVAHLSTLWKNVRPSTTEENIHLDIDCWVGDESVSIKTQHTSKRRYGGSITVELLMYDSWFDRWIPSWFYNGEATYYLWRIQQEVFLIRKSTLLDYLEEQGWDGVSEGLTERVKATQAHKRFTDFKNGKLNIYTLLDAGIAVPLPEMERKVKRYDYVVA
jgi:hypothetical protein